MSKLSLRIGMILVAVALVLLTGLSGATQLEDTKDTEDYLRGTSYTSVPSSFARFLFYHARPVESRQVGGGGLLGYKRSSSALDALTGVTLGKRAAGSVGLGQQMATPTVEPLNMDPSFGRQFGLRSTPRVYDLRWDSYDMPVGAEN